MEYLASGNENMDSSVDSEGVGGERMQLVYNIFTYSTRR
jgi:hypothetical protein